MQHSCMYASSIDHDRTHTSAAVNFASAGSSSRGHEVESTACPRVCRRGIPPAGIALCVSFPDSRKGGDCAERFVDCNRQSIENKFSILLQMALIVTWTAKLPVVKVGRYASCSSVHVCLVAGLTAASHRLAGQFAKPRSAATELIQGQEVPVFRVCTETSTCQNSF